MLPCTFEQRHTVLIFHSIKFSDFRNNFQNDQHLKCRNCEIVTKDRTSGVFPGPFLKPAVEDISENFLVTTKIFVYDHSDYKVVIDLILILLDTSQWIFLYFQL